MRCPGSGHWPSDIDRPREGRRLARGYCPHCGRSRAITRTGRIWRHNAPTTALTEGAASPRR